MSFQDQKKKSDGRTEGYKVRLVILVNTQVKCLDYHEIFALVAKIVTVQTL